MGLFLMLSTCPVLSVRQQSGCCTVGPVSFCGADALLLGAYWSVV